jgi:hypothetical protein
MTGDDQTITLAVRQFKVYALRIFPLWEGDAECLPVAGDLDQIVATIVAERSVSRFLGSEVKPIKFCQLEEQDAVFLPATGKTYYDNRQTPVWKLMVPGANVYGRDTILSCIARNAGRNVDKYRNVLFAYPKAERFFTSAGGEIRAVDDSVFVLEHGGR